MLATRTGSRVVFLVLAIGLIGSKSTYPQSATLFNTSVLPGKRMSSGVWSAKCMVSFANPSAATRFIDGNETPPRLLGPGDSNASSRPEEVCLDATPTPSWHALLDNPCPPNVAGGSDVPRTYPCTDVEDTVPTELSALGKLGLKIARAREGVLEILRSENACTEWFETKETAPAATFQSLNFLLDQHGPQDILELMNAESLVIRRQPYVAQATQDGGAHTTIRINANGAFYRPQGNVLKVGSEGGPVRAAGTRLLTVGSYRGDTLPAQMTALLHELGHIIDLLPTDSDTLDGKSVRNTDEVLRHCRTEVEGRAHQAQQTAKRQFVGIP